MKRVVRKLPAALVAWIAVVAAAPSANANHNLLSFMMDDDLLIYDTSGTREFSLDYMKRAGADGVRVTMSWKFVSGQENGKPVRQPARLRGARAENPRNYRADIWDRFDDIVRLARDRGMYVLFNVTGPGPVWAQPKAPFRRRFDQPAWKPNPVAFGRFVKAVGRRYSGTYVDENQGHETLPKVVVWSVYNEVNQPASLSPQLDYSARLHKTIPVAPILYRNLYYAATDALKATGHGDDLIMMGETAPLGAIRDTPRVHLWPKTFLREMFCVAPDGRPYRGLEAKVRQCDTLRRRGPFLVKAYAHHPYTQRNPPSRRDRFRDSINMANIGDLPRFLDFLAARTHLIPRGLPVALTEIGWETLPPDPTRGVSIDHQAEWLNQADHMAYDQPRVFMNTQFILRDVKPRAQFRGQARQLNNYWATWQSGLLFADGRPKPAFRAYIMPFDIRRSGRTLNMWGQLKLLTNGTPADVYLQFRPAGSRTWQLGGGPLHVEDQMGFWQTSLAAPGPGVWRAVIVLGESQIYSREVSVPL
jgi:hypothetical protein